MIIKVVGDPHVGRESGSPGKGKEDIFDRIGAGVL